MKTRKIYLVGISTLFVAFLITASVGATESLEVKTIENSKMISMELASPSADAINVILFDDTDRIVFQDQISAGATFEDSFDFSAEVAGTFRLVSEMGNMRYNRILQVSGDEVQFAESYYSFIPQFQMEGETLLVHYINEPQKDVGISLENKMGIVFDAFYDNQGSFFTEAFAMNRLQRGSYTMHLMSNGEMFSHAFSVE